MHQTFVEHWLVRDLSVEIQSTIYDLGEVQEVDTDQTIIQPNTANEAMYLLLEGAVKIRLPDAPERARGVTLGHRGPGDLIGEYSFVDSFRPSARVTASTPGRVLRIPHEPLRSLLDTDPRSSSIFYKNLLAYLVNRLRAQDEELACLML